jgi:hypothetical protein
MPVGDAGFMATDADIHRSYSCEFADPDAPKLKMPMPKYAWIGAAWFKPSWKTMYDKRNKHKRWFKPGDAPVTASSTSSSSSSSDDDHSSSGGGKAGKAKHTPGGGAGAGGHPSSRESSSSSDDDQDPGGGNRAPAAKTPQPLNEKEEHDRMTRVRQLVTRKHAGLISAKEAKKLLRARMTRIPTMPSPRVRECKRQRLNKLPNRPRRLGLQVLMPADRVVLQLEQELEQEGGNEDKVRYML